LKIRKRIKKEIALNIVEQDKNIKDDDCKDIYNEFSNSPNFFNDEIFKKPL
jgi:hypothetical protein